VVSEIERRSVPLSNRCESVAKEVEGLWGEMRALTESKKAQAPSTTAAPTPAGSAVQATEYAAPGEEDDSSSSMQKLIFTELERLQSGQKSLENGLLECSQSCKALPGGSNEVQTGLQSSVRILEQQASEIETRQEGILSVQGDLAGSLSRLEKTQIETRELTVYPRIERLEAAIDKATRQEENHALSHAKSLQETARLGMEVASLSTAIESVREFVLPFRETPSSFLMPPAELPMSPSSQLGELDVFKQGLEEEVRAGLEEVKKLNSLHKREHAARQREAQGGHLTTSGPLPGMAESEQVKSLREALVSQDSQWAEAVALMRGDISVLTSSWHDSTRTLLVLEREMDQLKSPGEGREALLEQGVSISALEASMKGMAQAVHAAGGWRLALAESVAGLEGRISDRIGEEVGTIRRGKGGLGALFERIQAVEVAAANESGLMSLVESRLEATWVKVDAMEAREGEERRAGRQEDARREEKLRQVWQRLQLLHEAITPTSPAPKAGAAAGAVEVGSTGAVGLEEDVLARLRAVEAFSERHEEALREEVAATSHAMSRENAALRAEIDETRRRIDSMDHEQAGAVEELALCPYMVITAL